MINIDRILVFDICGKFAHFKKYYSNVDSLTYDLPPRTVIVGIIASILGYPRDEYYEIFSPEKCKMTVNVEEPVKKHQECMNYRQKNGKPWQVRLELLMPKDERNSLRYKIYFCHKESDIMERLEQKLRKSDFGYGIYLGQRQFRGYVDLGSIEVYGKDEISFPTVTEVDNIKSLTYAENIEIDFTHDMELTQVIMPCDMKKVGKDREQKAMVRVCYERNGEPLKGKFKEALEVGEKRIAFFTPMTE